MTVKINKELGSKSTIVFKGLGDPGPFPITLVSGTMPSGTTFDPETFELKGTFNEVGESSFTLGTIIKNRIENKEEFTIKVSDWTLAKTDFKTDIDYYGQVWQKTGTVTKIINDSDLFDGTCYELNPGGLKITLPEAIGNRDFELELIIKPINNGTNSNSRLLMIGNWSVRGAFYINRYSSLIPPTLAFSIFRNTDGGNDTLYSISEYQSIVNNQWNNILLVRKKGMLTCFINNFRMSVIEFNHDIYQREVYIGSNNTNAEHFTCRVKKFSLKINDSSKFFDRIYPTDIWKYNFIDKQFILLSIIDNNDYLIECNFKGNYVVKVKSGFTLPTGLSLINNRIVGNSDLTDNVNVTFELYINNLLHNEITVELINKNKPYYILNLPMIGIINDIVFGDTKSRSWLKTGSVSIIEDHDNLRDHTSTLFVSSNSNLSLSDPSFNFNDDVCYSFWVKTKSNTSGYIFCHFLDNSNYLAIHTGSTVFNISLVLNGGTHWISYNVPNTLITNQYNHFVLVRKNNIWRTLINGKIISETNTSINILGNTIYIGGSPFGSSFNGSIFDFKVSTFKLEYWDEFIPPLVTKWYSQIEVINTYVNSIITNKRITSNCPYKDVFYKVNDFSAIPVGLTLLSNGKIIGSPSAPFTGIVKVDCFINGVLNHIVDVFFNITYYDI